MSAPGERYLALVAEVRKRIREISPADAAREAAAGAVLLDVRETVEFSRRHIKGALHLGKGIVESEIELRIPSIDTPILCYCAGGNRSALVTENLERMGYTNIRSVAGGIRAWVESGLPTVTPREALD